MSRRTLLALALLVPLLAPKPGAAHAPRIGPHGGQLVDAGPYHVEVVAAEGGIDVFVSDAQDRPLPATGFRGVAVVVANGRPLRIPLEARRPDRLFGAGQLPPGQPVKGVIQLTAPDGSAASARLE